MRSRPRNLGSAVVVALSALAFACGGGSGGGGGGGGGSAFDASFTPELASPGNLTVALGNAPAGSGDLVVIQVLVTDTDDVYGADFTLLYDPTSLEYVRRYDGQLLETGGQGVVYEARVSQPGALVVGASRVTPGPGVDATGSRVLMSLAFRATRSGTTDLAFGDADLLDSGSAPQPISGLSWYGGTVVAN
jgi:hypothetical protein